MVFYLPAFKLFSIRLYLPALVTSPLLSPNNFTVSYVPSSMCLYHCLSSDDLSPHTAPWGNAVALHPHRTAKVRALEYTQDCSAHQPLSPVHKLHPQDMAASNERWYSILQFLTTATLNLIILILQTCIILL